MASVSPLKRGIALIVLLAVLLFAAFVWVRPLLNIGSGYAAKHACSCHFLQGRQLDEISEHDLNFSVLGWFSLGAADGRSVSASLLGMVRRTAVYRPGIGCTLLNDGSASLAEVAVGGAAGAAQYPENRQTLGFGLPAEWDGPGLGAALEYGMRPVPGGGARGIVVYWRGRLVAEAYAEGFSADTPLLGWSMTKSLAGMAVGAVLYGRDAGRVNSAPAPPPDSLTGLFPEKWTDERADISLADLLHMNSGLAWNEGYGSLTDATIMLHERPDFAAYAAEMPAVAPPGSRWNYSSGTTNILVEYLSRELGGNDSLYAFLYDSLFHRIAPSLRIEPDQSGRPVGSSYGWATARDWANLGQFMLQDGVWRGDTLLPPGWVDYLRQPAAGSDGVYGAQLWLPGPDMPSLPPDAYMMRGFQDQRVFVIPGRELVIARLGHGEDKVTDFNGLVERVLAAQRHVPFLPQ